MGLSNERYKEVRRVTESRRGSGNKVAMFALKYIGSKGAANVTAGAGGSMYLFASTSADSTITGGTGYTAGKILLTNASVDTVNEFCAVINAQANWRAWPVDGLPGDPTSNLNDAQATNVSGAGDAETNGGIMVYYTNHTAKKLQVGISHKNAHNVKTDASAKSRCRVDRVAVTFASGQVTSAFVEVIACDDVNGVTRTIHCERPKVGTTARVFTTTYDYSVAPIYGPVGQRLVVRVTGATDLSTIADNHILNVIGAVEEPVTGGQFSAT